MWWLIGIWALVVLAGTALESLNLRHLRAHGHEVPPELAGVVDTSALQAIAAYTLERGRLHRVKTLVLQAAVGLLFAGGLAWYRAVTGLVRRRGSRRRGSGRFPGAAPATLHPAGRAVPGRHPALGDARGSAFFALWQFPRRSAARLQSPDAPAGNPYRALFSSTASGTYSSRKNTLKALKAGMDKTYETDADNEVNRRPKLGDNTLKPSGTVLAGVAIKLSKRINLAIEDRWTFVKTDLLDGQRWQEHAWVMLF